MRKEATGKNVVKPVYVNEKIMDEFVNVVMSAHGRSINESYGFGTVTGDSKKKLKSAMVSVLSMYPERYETLSRQAAELACRIAQDHCFPDGNKRTAIVATTAFLETYGHAVSCSQDDFVAAALAASQGNVGEVMQFLGLKNDNEHKELAEFEQSALDDLMQMDEHSLDLVAA